MKLINLEKAIEYAKVFNKEKQYENRRYRGKYKPLPGLFSRKNKDDSSMPIDKIYLIAQIFNVSMDDMCSNIALKELEENAKEFGYKLVPIGEEE